MVAAAVIIHLAADGTELTDQTQCNITVHLVDTKEGIHNLGENFLMYSQTESVKTHASHKWQHVPLLTCCQGFSENIDL